MTLRLMRMFVLSSALLLYGTLFVLFAIRAEANVPEEPGAGKPRAGIRARTGG